MGTKARRLKPVAVLGGLTFRHLRAGYNHTCGVIGGGINSLTPRGVGAQTFRSVSVGLQGSAHTCAVGTNSLAYCWGSNAFGKLGDGTTATRATPLAVLGP